MAQEGHRSASDSQDVVPLVSQELPTDGIAVQSEPLPLDQALPSQTALSDTAQSSRETLVWGTGSFGSAAGSDGSREFHAPTDAWSVRRRFLLPVIAPGIFMGKANMIVAPMLPILIRVDLHGSVGDVSLVLVAGSAGQLISSVPVGILISKLRHDVASRSALSILILISFMCFAAPNVMVLAMLRFLNGAVSCAWDVSQKTLLAAEVPKAVRGRISATLAGSNKFAIVFATLLGGASAHYLTTRSVFLLRAILVSVSLLLLSIHVWRNRAARDSSTWRLTGQPYQEGAVEGSRARGQAQQHVGVMSLLRRTWRDLLGAGFFCSMLNGVRTTYMILLPLKAHQIGLTKIEIGFTVAVLRAAESVLALTSSGQIMDRYGQKAAGLPSILIIGLAYGVTPMCSNMPLLIASSLLFSLGNGLSAGIVVSYQTGLAPDYARSKFLGLWKMVTATGGFIVPPLFGAVSDLTDSLEAAAVAVSLMCIFAALWLMFCVRSSSPSVMQFSGPHGQSLPLNPVQTPLRPI